MIVATHRESNLHMMGGGGNPHGSPHLQECSARARGKAREPRGSAVSVNRKGEEKQWATWLLRNVKLKSKHGEIYGPLTDDEPKLFAQLLHVTVVALQELSYETARAGENTADFVISHTLDWCRSPTATLTRLMQRIGMHGVLLLEHCGIRYDDASCGSGSCEPSFQSYLRLVLSAVDPMSTESKTLEVLDIIHSNSRWVGQACRMIVIAHADSGMQLQRGVRSTDEPKLSPVV